MDALAPLSFLPLRLSRNPIAYTIDALPDTVLERANLSYILCVKTPKSYGSGEYGVLVQLPGREFPKRSELGAEYYPGAQFDAGVFVDDALKRTPPQPNQTGIVTCGDMITPYLVQTRVENAGVVVPDSIKTLPLEYAIKGSLGVEQFAAWRDQFFTGYLADSRRFLTWQPVEKWVDVNQPEFLYYLVNFTPRPLELRLKVDLYYTDGTADTLTAQRMTTVGQYVVYGIPVGFVALGLPEREAAQGKEVHSYKVWISNETDQRLSEVRTYYVQRDYEANVRFLLFANSLGGYDTLRCTGQTARSLTVKGTNAQRALDPAYLPGTAELFSLNRLGERIITLNTGLRDGDELDYLSEIALSDELYIVANEGFVALVPTDNPLSLRTDDEDLAGRTLSFRYAKNQVGYSDLPAAPTVPTRPTRWVPVNTFCIIDDNGKRTGYMAAAKLELRYVDDGTLVKPRRSKANTPGTEGYQPAIVSAACTTTPFVNALVERPGTYKRNNCGADQEPTVATLSIPANTYGAETADQLQSRIDAALAQLDTQDYANQFGACLTNPALYTYAVPVGKFHYRANQPSKLAIETASNPYMGNAWTMQGYGGPNVFAVGSNDLDFPVGSTSVDQFRLFVYGTPYALKRLRIYKNGVVFRDEQFTINVDGYEYRSLFGFVNNGSTGYTTIASTDRLYVQLTDL